MTDTSVEARALHQAISNHTRTKSFVHDDNPNVTEVRVSARKALFLGKNTANIAASLTGIRGVFTQRNTAFDPATVLNVHNIVSRGNPHELVALLESCVDDLDCVELVNASTKSGSTPLFTAAWNGNAQMLETLLGYGAKPNWTNVKRNCAMHMVSTG